VFIVRSQRRDSLDIGYGFNGNLPRKQGIWFAGDQ